MVRSDLDKLPAYVPGKALPDALRLASNETAAAPLPAVQQAVAEAAAGLNRYPDMGVQKLREELATWLSRTPHAGVEGTPGIEAKNVVVGNGSSALCLQAIQATCLGGDEVVFPWRSFEAYPILTQIAGATPVPVPLTGEHRVDLQAMLGAISSATRLVFICNPNNPTGTALTQPELQEFLDAAPPQVHVLLDEAYIEYDRSNNGVNGLELLQKYPNLSVCRTFSKAYGLAGARLGYLVSGAEFIEAMSKVAIPFGVNSLAQVAGLASVGEQAQDQLHERVEATVEQRGRVERFLAQRLPEDMRASSQANFIWLPLGAKAEEFEATMRDLGVLTRCFAGEGVRITITDSAETDTLLDALDKALAATLG